MDHPRLDRADLELVVSIVDGGSLINAAKTLRVHHATAFRRLADMESRAQVPLFERLPEGYAATPAGRALSDRARRLLEDLRALDAQTLELASAGAEPLRVTASDGLATAFFPPLLKAFADTHPEIAIDFVIDNRVLSVSGHEVDIALRPARQVSGDMVCRKLGKVGYTLYASASYVRGHGRLDGAHLDFTGHAICRYHESIAYFTTGKWLERHAASARIAAICNTLTGMQALARSGMCIAALPCAVGDGDEGLVRLLPPIAAMETGLWVCTHKRLRKAPRVRAFLDFFYAEAAKEAPRLAGTASARRKSA